MGQAQANHIIKSGTTKLRKHYPLAWCLLQQCLKICNACGRLDFGDRQCDTIKVENFKPRKLSTRKQESLGLFLVLLWPQTYEYTNVLNDQHWFSKKFQNRIYRHFPFATISGFFSSDMASSLGPENCWTDSGMLFPSLSSWIHPTATGMPLNHVMPLSTSIVLVFLKRLMDVKPRNILTRQGRMVCIHF